MTKFLNATKISFFDFDKWVLSMLYCNSIDLSKGIDITNSDNSKESSAYHYREGFPYWGYTEESPSPADKIYSSNNSSPVDSLHQSFVPLPPISQPLNNNFHNTTQ